MIILSLLTGVLGFGNFYALANNMYAVPLGLCIQVGIALIAVISVFLYKGRKSRPSYSEWGVSYFTLRFAIVLLLALGNLLLLAVFFLRMTGRISNL